MTDTIRIYAACLASYNSGVLHGRWIDADSDVDTMQAEISAMLRESPFPNVMVADYDATATAAGWSNGPDAISNIPNAEGYWMKEGVTEEAGNYRAYIDAREVCEGESLTVVQVPSAEEWAIHDSEGLPSSFGEYASLAKIAAFVELVEDNDNIDADVISALVDNHCGDVEAAEGELEKFIGVYENFKAYAEEAADEMIAAHNENGKLPDCITNYFDYDAYARDLKHEMTVIECENGVAVFHN